MQENQHNIVIIRGLKKAIYEIQKYASFKSKGINLPSVEFDLSFGKDGFYGKRKVELNYSPIISRFRNLIIIQEGRFPSAELTFGDLTRMNSKKYFGEDDFRSEMGNLTDKTIQRIEGCIYCNPDLPVYSMQLSGEVNFHYDNSTYVFFEIENTNAHRFDIRKKTDPQPYNFKGIGFGGIRGNNLEDKFLDFIGTIFTKYEAEKTYFSSDKKTIPLSDIDKLSFNLNDFAFYFLLTGNGELNLVNKAQQLASKSEPLSGDDELIGRTDLLIENISKNGSQLIKPFILTTETIDGKINPANEAYQLLISEETQKVIQFLNKFMQDNKARYEPLLNSLEAKLKQEPQTVLQK